MSARIYYFGCGGRRWTPEGWRWAAGHYLYEPGLRALRDEPPGWPHSLHHFYPGALLDGKLAPRLPGRGGRSGEEAPEGHAVLRHIEGWTFLAFWDRSADRRGASNSVFALDGVHDFNAAVALSRAAFPNVWERFPFDVVQHNLNEAA